PTEAVLMSDTFEMAQYSRDNLYLDMHWLYENQLRYEQHHPDRVQPAAAGTANGEQAGES
ncbi:MAG: NADH-quinone oxidoreductase subunit I, partial [Alicyclobacillus sp.]|nr:NADH-quinone oxidoreductase subunit I [Alicyclobacillus sp.]